MKPSRRITNVLILAFFALYGLTGAYIAYVLDIYHNDTVARAALGFFTVFGREPHLSALGFVWQPLPSLLQIPLFFLFRPFGDVILPGILLSSLAGALSVNLIYRTGVLCAKGVKTKLPILIAILFGLNPMILLYAAIGSSEMLFIVSILAATYYLVKWYFQPTQVSILLASIFMALSFWSRYEAVPAFIGTISLIIFNMLLLRRDLRKTESSLMQYALPFVYSVLFWILANWMIMKDPFYFMNSSYSNASLTGELRNNPSLMEYSFGSFWNSVLYAGKRIAFLAPVIAIVPVLLLPSIHKIRLKINEVALFLFLTIPYGFIIFFHIHQIYKGQSYGWMRFFIYSILAGSLIAIYVATRKKKIVYKYVTMVLLVLGLFTTGYAMTTIQYGKEEHSFIRKAFVKEDPAVYSKSFASRTFADQKAVAKYLDGKEGKVLIDTDDGFAVPLFSSDPKRYIIRSDTDFESVVRAYPSKVSWVIVPEPKDGVKDRNKIYSYYPEIWEGKAPSVVLEKQIEGWKIFRVTPVAGLPSATSSALLIK